jgi:DNA replication regulator DPB11
MFFVQLLQLQCLLTQWLQTELAAVAIQMGAIHKYDLTSDVTHLIVGNIDTPKYKYVAKERPDVKVLTPDWLEAVRLSWMKGGDTDVAALEEEYQVPTFQGLRICVTGFDDSELDTSITLRTARQRNCSGTEAVHF